MATVYLNGEYLPLEQARVSVLDRGFIFGDGIYEVIPVFSGVPFREKEHLERLDRSLAAISLQLQLDGTLWHAIFTRLLEENSVDATGSIYIQVTRGSSEREHVFTEDYTPTVLVMCKSIDARQFDQGIKVITHEDIRWNYCDIKAITLLPNVLLRQKAQQAGAFEAILVKDGRVTEGAASNVFVVRDGVIRTPPKNSDLLPGITRDLVVELARDNTIACEETVIEEAELFVADEIWITSSTLGIAPVVEIDGRKVGSGTPGKIWQEITRIYDNFREGNRRQDSA